MTNSDSSPTLVTLTPGEKKIDPSYDSFRATAEIFGAKAAGLSCLPASWTPDFIAFSFAPFRSWKLSGEIPEKYVSAALRWMDKHKQSSIAVRSSGRGETISDRGKYKSVITKTSPGRGDIISAMKEVFRDSMEKDSSDEMGIIFQRYAVPSEQGHLTNEVRLSPTRNQWVYEYEKPYSPASGINSKSAPLPDPTSKFTPGRALHQTFRSIGRWCCQNFSPRCHLEWVRSDNKFWLVQLDFEWPELDEGTDPTASIISSQGLLPNPTAARNFELYELGSTTRWQKLRNLNDFDFGAEHPAPRIYKISARDILKSTNYGNLAEDLISEISQLTANRAVVRTEDQSEGVSPFNQPRTDTVSAEKALHWCQETVQKLTSAGSNVDDIAFLLHAYLPARASAWVYASPDGQTVKVDALWGFPDGLQVLPFDEYEVVPKRNAYLEPRSTFKPMFLAEDDDGNWIYKNVKRGRGRSKVLSKADVLEIAARTYNISNTLKTDAQIMWFCGVPDEYGVGRNVPWYRSREKIDAAPRIDAKYVDFDVSRPSDLGKLPVPHCTIRLMPDAELIRDEGFLQQVIDKAIEHQIPVKLEGSILGHIYYRLRQEGVGVVLPNVAKYRKAPEKQHFGKLVRDLVPQNIRDGGEEVIEARLRQEDVALALSSKLVEELEEYLLSTTKEEMVDELGDLLEVLRGLSTSSGISWHSVLEASERKRQKNGGFDERRVLLETSLPSSRKIDGREELVSLSQISQPSRGDRRVEVPFHSLLVGHGRVGEDISFADTSFAQLKMALSRGKVVISRGSTKPQAHPKGQLELFPLESDKDD